MTRDWTTMKAGVKLLVFVVVTVVSTALLAVTIGNIGTGRTERYTAVFSDVTGLEEGDDIRSSGVQIGQVDTIEARGKHAEVTFEVEAGRQLSTTTEVQLRYLNLIGQRYIALVPKAGESKPLPAGATIPLKQTKPALDLTVLFNGFKPLFSALSPKDINQLSFEIIQVLQGEEGTVEGLLAHTASLTNSLADKDKVIGELITNLNSVLKTVGDRDDELTSLIRELQRLMNGLAGDRKAIGESLSSIVKLNEETAGLLEEGRPELKKDVAELRRVATTLDKNSPEVERVLKTMPKKLRDITRTATYGSWFNFYLCDLDARVVLPDGTELQRPSLHVDSKRCQRDSGGG